MPRSRWPAIAALLGALALAGCGLGAGAGVGEVSVTMTRDFGSRALGPVATVTADESSTVMRVLESEHDVGTRYGGAYVKSIDDLDESESGGHPRDWFYFVDGLEAGIGASDYPLHGGEQIWWDFRDWTATDHVGAIVGQFPAPFTGYGGYLHQVAVECMGGGSACDRVEATLRREGAKTVERASRSTIRVLVGPWEEIESDAAAASIGEGPGESGVYALFRANTPGEPAALYGLDPGATVSRRFGPSAGLVAATRRYEGPPVWVVTGATVAGVEAAAEVFDEPDLHDHFAVAVEGGHEVPLPLDPAD